MRVFKTIESLRAEILGLRRDGHQISLVPTMGYLHEGHLSLVRRCPESKVFASIFVNPLQFNDKKDFEAYPTDVDRDLGLLKQEGVCGVFIPHTEEIYPRGEVSRVSVPGLSDVLEGAFRPGHFEGVTTVVAKLFNIFEPDYAAFGEKDFQQLRIVEKLVTDLRYRVKIVRGPLVREESGLAMSSRNARLSCEGRSIASSLSKALFMAKDAAKRGASTSDNLRALVSDYLSKVRGIELEYVEVVTESDLSPTKEIGSGSRILAAIWVEGVRLIDNTPL